MMRDQVTAGGVFVSKTYRVTWLLGQVAQRACSLHRSEYNTNAAPQKTSEGIPAGHTVSCVHPARTRGVTLFGAVGKKHRSTGEICWFCAEPNPVTVRVGLLARAAQVVSCVVQSYVCDMKDVPFSYMVLRVCRLGFGCDTYNRLLFRVCLNGGVVMRV